MKSINSKIILILGIGLLFQIVIVGSFYQLVITKKVIYEINNNSNLRQQRLTEVVKSIELLDGDVQDIQNYLLQYSQSYNIDFKLKDFDGKIIYVTTFADVMNKKIEDRAIIESGDKPKYLVYAYFPTKIDNLLISVKGNDTKMVLAGIVAVIATLMALTIYWTVGKPLRKLRSAIEDMDYGNTQIEIPYRGKDEIGQLCRRLEDMGTRLKKSEDSQKQMLQAISHDLKTPLTSMIGYIRRLYDGKVSSEEKRTEYYEIINRKTMDLKYLIDELEDLSNLYVSASLKLESVDLNEFYLHLCKELESEVTQKEKKFDAGNWIEGNPEILIEEVRIRRVVANIVNNSFKYAGPEADVFLNCTTKRKHALFELGDKGAGVTEEELDKIFNRFYRVEASRSREMGGTGLGLAICKDIIESHGGVIWAKNNKYGGLSILFTLPIAYDNEK